MITLRFRWQPHLLNLQFIAQRAPAAAQVRGWRCARHWGRQALVTLLVTADQVAGPAEGLGSNGQTQRQVLMDREGNVELDEGHTDDC